MQGLVKERVKSVLNYKNPTFWMIGLIMLGCALIAALFLTDPKEEAHRAYHLKELDEFFEGRSVEDFIRLGEYKTAYLKMEEVNEHFPMENMRSYKYKDEIVTSYTVYPVKEGGYYYVFWSTIIDEGIRKIQPYSSVMSTAYISTPTRDASLFDSIKSGISTAGDVEVIDPYVYMDFTRSSGIFSFSYLDSENVLEVEYDPKIVEEISDYKNMIVRSVKVRPRSMSYPYEYISNEDLPKRKSEELDLLKEGADVINTYYETSEEDWEKQREKGMPVYFTTHYELSDGMWTTNERCYKYRLDLTGRAEDTNITYRFILLSNINDITFEQVWEQWSLHNSNDEYFHPDDTIIVGIG